MAYLFLNVIVCLVVFVLLSVFTRKNMLLFLCLLNDLQFVLLFLFALVFSFDDVLLIRQTFIMCILSITCIFLFFFNQKNKVLSFILLLLPLIVIAFTNIIGGYFVMG